MTPPILHLEAVEKVYRSEDVETRALHGVTLSIFAGEFLAITGPSGCGKSTLLNILGLLDQPSAGGVYLDGQAMELSDEKRLTRARRGTIGFIFQSFNLIDTLSVIENVAMPLRYLGQTGPERKKRAMEVLEHVGLSHRAGHRPAQLSGGQQQRVAIARALAVRPRLLLADEPTGNLDTENGAVVLDLLRRLPGEATAVAMVTHDDAVAAAAPRQVSMRDGLVLADRIRTP